MLSNDEAIEIYRKLALKVDIALKEVERNKDNPPTDGGIAVLVIFRELESMGYVLAKRELLVKLAKK